ncbi:MAG: efflux RND transporter periplasmic adaptor subunit [Spirochaetaceae bacterium]|jgi:multidrug efflux pump subunit AcrA (membrane-fusion protein)|nr:efflux RND transporter periplasmic adaptor subunit [Spirochaetaceae bacterium]
MKKNVMVFVVLLTAAMLIFVPALLASCSAQAKKAGGSGKGEAENAAAVFAVRTKDAEIRTLQAYIEVNGNIVSEQQVAVMPEAAGKLAAMYVALGSRVRKGALVAQVDPSRPGAQYSFSPVHAPVSGVVVSAPAAEGSTVSTATPLFTIAAAETLEIEALIPEREVGQLRTGLQAEVLLEAFPGEVFFAEVVRVSPVVDSLSRTKKIALRFLQNDSRINLGMFARVKLNTRTYENVVSIPQDALIDNRGTQAVYVLDGSDGETARAFLKPVETGVQVDGELEIKSGLASGEKVIVQGQQFLTDGAAVRVLGSK